MTDLPKPSKSITLLNMLIKKLESRAERVVEQSSNHELISKMTFLLVVGMSYEILGEKIITLIAALI